MQGGGLPAVGSLVAGRYQIRSLLGRGGMGAVYVAWDGQLGSEVALKMLLANAELDAGALTRFEREASALARVDQHPGIVRVRDFGQAGGLPYVVMDLVRGRDLSAHVTEAGRLDANEAARIAEGIARAIHHCHERGIVHRDLKPANVLLREDGTPLVTDFGLAADRDAERMTRTGELLGTPAYMSPEQADGDWSKVDGRTDVYAVGAILYHLLAGRAPFEGATALAILTKVFDRAPDALPADVPADLDAICQRAMAKDPERRYASAAELADDLARLRRGDPIRARPPGRGELFRWRLRRRDPRAVVPAATALLLGIAAAAGVGYALIRDADPEQVAEDQLGQLLDDLPQLLAKESPLGGSTLEASVNELHAECTKAVGGGAVSGESVRQKADTLANLVEGLADAPDSDPSARLLRRVIDGDPVRERNLRALVRRAGFCYRLGHRGGLPPPGKDADPEDLLMDALRRVGWRQKSAHPWDPSEIDAARGQLRRARGPGPVGQAAKAVGEEVSALLAVVADERRRIQVALDPRRPQAFESHTERVEKILAGPLEASLRGGVGGFKATTALASLDRVFADLKQERGNYASPRPYRRLRGLVAAVTAVWKARPSPEREQVDRRIVTCVTELSARAKESEVNGEALLAWAELINEVPPSLWTGRELRIHHMLNVALGLMLKDPRKNSEVGPLVILTAFRQNPGAKLLRQPIERLVDADAFKAHLQDTKRPTGNLFFTWAACHESLLTGRDLAEPKHHELLRSLFAKALGRSLGEGDRARLGLGPEDFEELTVPLTSTWRGYARWRLARQLEAALKAKAPEKRTAGEWEAVVGEHRFLHAHKEWFVDGETLEGLDHWIVCSVELGHVSRNLRNFLRARGELTPERERELVDEVVAALAGAEEAAWQLVELNADGSPEAQRRLGIVAGSTLTLRSGVADQRRNVNRLLMRALRDGAYLLRESGRAAETLSVFPAAAKRLEAAGIAAPPWLRVDWAWAEFDAGQYDQAQAKILNVIEELRGELSGADRDEIRPELDASYRLLAQIEFARGKPEAARKAYRAAKEQGLTNETLWAPLVERLEQGQ